MQERRGPIGMIILKLSGHVPVRFTEWLLAGIMLSWGITCLSVPAPVWNEPAYSGLRSLGTQTAWGAYSLALGLTRIGALYINGAMRRSPHLRTAGAFLAVLLWLQLTLAMFNGQAQSLSISIYPWLFVGDLFNVYRASQDARLSDLRAKAKIQARGEARDAEQPAA